MNQFTTNTINQSLLTKSSQFTPKYQLRDQTQKTDEEKYNDFISRYGMSTVDGKVMISKFTCFSIDRI